MAKNPNKKRVAKSKPASETIRKLKQPNYRSFRLHKKIKHPTKLPSSFVLLKSTIKLVVTNWKPFAMLALIYGLLSIILVRGFGSGLQLNDLKNELRLGFDGSFAELSTSLTVFGYVLGSAGSVRGETGGLYQAILALVFSLAIIWAIRQLHAGQKIKAKEALYSGMGPLIPFVLVLTVVGLQFIPMLTGSWLYGLVVANGIAVTAPEKFLWGLVFLVLAILSLYMLCSSAFALYISTLPNMAPMKALRSARQLVLHRRWTVLRKILFLPFSLLIITTLIMVPIILFATSLAEWVFFALGTVVIVGVHGYMYSLYRSLLK